ncbi:YkuS family protein [Paenibacillus aurantius]|uniref:YkuS family protein n=1 Tax=Paenibacillus aurantius TaxID=2918900 RepID=A0AA96LHA3_9BACL|nr:YkuS family protein [Paenibacillus aurantius]WNQ13836.1 YkuS family protein [Paenibacillus aurantius]
MARIAVENSLSHMTEALQNSGHEVVSMDQAEGCDCCVISGQDANMMGISNAVTQASVINAEGLTDEEILNRINESMANR